MMVSAFNSHLCRVQILISTGSVNPVNNNTIDFLKFDFTDSSVPQFMDLGNFDWANDKVFNMMSQTVIDNPLESYGSSVAVPSVHTPDSIGNTAPTHQTLVPNGSLIAPPQVSTNTSQTSVPFNAQAIRPPAVNSPPVHAPVVNAAVNAPPAHVPVVNATNAAVNPLPVHAPVTNTASHASLHTSVLAPNQSVGFRALVPSAPTTVPATVPTPNVSTIATPFLDSPGFNTAGFPTIHPPTFNLSTPPSTFTTVAPPTVAYASAVNTPAPTSSTIQIPGPTTAAAQPGATAPAWHNSGAIVFTTPATTSGSATVPPPAFQVPNPGVDFNQAQADRTPFNDLDNGIRRSNRAPVPSTRLDKLNEIGDNIAPPKPPIDPLAPPVKPTWFDPAYEHLKRSNLGEAWTRLVEKWAEHEHVKGWKAGKVRIIAFSSPVYELTHIQSRASLPNVDQKSGHNFFQKLDPESEITKASPMSKMPPNSELPSSIGSRHSLLPILVEPVLTALCRYSLCWLGGGQQL
jgi:hypothetical protein